MPPMLRRLLRRSSLIFQTRRTMLLGLGGLGIAALSPRAWAAPADANRALADALAALEKSSGGRLGFAGLDCKDGTVAGHRLNARFTMCSTFKLSLAALILKRIDAGALAKGAMLPIARKDLVGHAPVVEAALGKGLKALDIVTLARAAQTESDNGAANILLRRIGGPAVLTAFWRSLGDGVSRLDRYEPALNTSHDGDPRDTTTPAAIAGSLRMILTGAVLKPASRDMLIGWMEGTQTGLKRLRARLPKGWRAGDKTGTMNGAAYADKTNDLAIVWRPARAEPFILTGFFEGKADSAEAVLAQAARIAARWMESRTP